jgi:hypothetical protein
MPSTLFQVEHCALCQLAPLLAAIAISLVPIVLGLWFSYRFMLPDAVFIPTTPPPQFS